MTTQSAQALADMLAPKNTVLNFNNMDLKDLPLVFTRSISDGTISSYAGVSLKSNRLASVPLDLAKVQTLRVIWLDENRITSLPPLALFAHIQFLSLRRNRLTKLPPTIADLASLVVFDVSDNQLVRLPAELARLSYLKIVVATGNSSIRSLPLDLARATTIRVDFETPATFPPNLSATGILEYIEAMNARKLALSLTSHWQRSELSCRVCSSRFPPNKPHHCRVCGARVCGKCSEDRVIVPCFQVDEALRVCRVCAVELHSTKCQRFAVTVAPPGTSGSGISKSTVRPAVEPPTFQTEADAKLADAMGVLQRYKLEHESELASLRAELQPNQPPEERRKTKAALNTKALEAMTVCEKVDSLVVAAATRAMAQQSKYAAMKRGVRPVPVLAPLPPPLTTASPPLSPSGAAALSPRLHAIYEQTPSPPHERPVTVFTLMPPPRDPTTTSQASTPLSPRSVEPASSPPTSALSSTTPLATTTQPLPPAPSLTPSASIPQPVISSSWRGRRGGEVEALQAEVMAARSLAAASAPPAKDIATSPPTASPFSATPLLPPPSLALNTASTSSARSAGKFKAVGAPPPLVPPPLLSPPSSSAPSATLKIAAPPPPLQLSNKAKTPAPAISTPISAPTAPVSALPPPITPTMSAGKKERSDLTVAISSIPPPMMNSTTSKDNVASPASPPTSLPNSPTPSPRPPPLPPPSAIPSSLPSPRAKASFPTTAPPQLPPAAAAPAPPIPQIPPPLSTLTKMRSATEEKKQLPDAGGALPTPLRERAATDGKGLKKPAALPPPPVLNSQSSSQRKHVALPSVKPPPTFEAVLGALDEAEAALATEKNEAPGAPPVKVKNLPVYRARRTIKPVTGRELLLRAGDVVMVADSSNPDWWFGISAGAAGWLPASSVFLAQEASFSDDESSPPPTDAPQKETDKVEETPVTASPLKKPLASIKTAPPPPAPIEKKEETKENTEKKTPTPTPDKKDDGLPYRKKFILPSKKPPAASAAPAVAAAKSPPPLPAPIVKEEVINKPLPKLPPKLEKKPIDPIEEAFAVVEVEVEEEEEEEEGGEKQQPESTADDAEFDLDQLEAQLSLEKSARKKAASAAKDDEEPIVPWSPWAALTSAPSILFDENAPVSLSPRSENDPLDVAMRSLMQS